MKAVNYVLAGAVVVFVSIYVFNHINAWVGIAIPFVAGYWALSKVINKIKSELNDEEK
jgi:succinate-acetate transporter protein